MKTEHLAGNSSNSSDPIWASNVELLPSEECLPIIGSCQVSSILQNLDTVHHDHNLQNMDLIILHANDYKLPLEAPLNLHTNGYIVLKDSIAVETCSNSSTGSNFLLEKAATIDDNHAKPTDLSLNIVVETSNSSHTSSISSKHYDRESFEDMLYFVCNLCPFLCTQENKITDHLERVHKNKTVSKLVQLKCPACSNIFYHRASLKSHLLHDHCVASSDLNLIVQAVIFYSNKENKKAECIKNEVETTACKDKVVTLGKPAIESVRLDAIHKSNEVKSLEMPPQQKVSLPQVDIIPSDSNKLITNLMKKTEPIVKYNSQKCVYSSCKVLLSDAKKMDYHIESHWNEGFRCLECQEKFVLWKPLTSHLWRLHKLDMELFSCERCDYKTNSLSKLNTVHKPTHSSIKAFKCDICEKFFKTRKQLRNHKRIHRENVERQMESCELCTKTFSDKRRLRSHMDSVHKKLKPFLCNYCGYKGSSRASLRMHIRSHTGEKPYACDQCKYTTADHNSLRRHKLRHTGQKPYKCSYCSYACIQSTTYKVHLKTKHPGMEKDLLFACVKCQFRTVNKDMYTAHLATTHKEICSN